MRHTGRARGRSVVRGGGIGRRLLALDAELVGAFDTVEREGEAAEVLGRTGSSRAPSSAIVRSASVRRVSIAMRALSPSAPGSRVRSHSSAKRSVSRCRQIRPSMRSAQRPSAGRARAQRRARTPRHDLVDGGAALDRCGHGVLDRAQQRLVRRALALRAHGVPLVVALHHGAMLLRMPRHVHRTMVRGGRASLRHAFPGSVWSGLGFALRCPQIESRDLPHRPINASVSLTFVAGSQPSGGHAAKQPSRWQDRFAPRCQRNGAPFRTRPSCIGVWRSSTL